MDHDDAAVPVDTDRAAPGIPSPAASPRPARAAGSTPDGTGARAGVGLGGRGRTGGRRGVDAGRSTSLGIAIDRQIAMLEFIARARGVRVATVREEAVTARRIRCVVYANSSLGRGKRTTVAHQVRMCEAEARGRGWEVAGVYVDTARGGVAHRRRELATLLADAASLDVDWVLVEHTDRLAGDDAGLAAVTRDLRRRGAAIMDVRLVGAPAIGGKRWS